MMIAQAANAATSKPPAPISILILGAPGGGTSLAVDVVSRAARRTRPTVQRTQLHAWSPPDPLSAAVIALGPCADAEVHDYDLVLAFSSIFVRRAAHLLKPGGRALVVEHDSRFLCSRRPAREARLLDWSARIQAIVLPGDHGSASLAVAALVGAASAELDLPGAAWQRALAECLRPRDLRQARRVFGSQRFLALARRRISR